MRFPWPKQQAEISYNLNNTISMDEWKLPILIKLYPNLSHSVPKPVHKAAFHSGGKTHVTG